MLMVNLLQNQFNIVHKIKYNFNLNGINIHYLLLLLYMSFLVMALEDFIIKKYPSQVQLIIAK